MTISKLDMVACAKRELALRERVYPKWISLGKITHAKASFEIRCMRAIIAKLEALPDDPVVQPDLVGGDRGRRT